MRIKPVSNVETAREVIIVFAVFPGDNVLKEADSKRHIIAASAMLAGLSLLTIG